MTTGTDVLKSQLKIKSFQCTVLLIIIYDYVLDSKKTLNVLKYLISMDIVCTVYTAVVDETRFDIIWYLYYCVFYVVDMQYNMIMRSGFSVLFGTCNNKSYRTCCARRCT